MTLVLDREVRPIHGENNLNVERTFSGLQLDYINYRYILCIIKDTHPR